MPTPTTDQPPKKYSFVQSKIANRIQSTQEDALIFMRQHLQKVNNPENNDPL